MRFIFSAFIAISLLALSCAAPAANRQAINDITKGMDEVRKEQFAEGLADLNSGLQSDPKLGSAKVFNARREAHVTLGHWKPALADASKAIVFNPSDGWLYNARGQIYCHLKQDKLAIEDFVKASKLIPTHVWTYVELGHCYDATGQFDKAISAYSKAISMSSNNIKFHQFRANSYEKIGRKDLAKKDREYALDSSGGWNADLFPTHLK